MPRLHPAVGARTQAVSPDLPGAGWRDRAPRLPQRAPHLSGARARAPRVPLRALAGAAVPAALPRDGIRLADLSLHARPVDDRQVVPTSGGVAAVERRTRIGSPAVAGPVGGGAAHRDHRLLRRCEVGGDSGRHRGRCLLAGRRGPALRAGAQERLVARDGRRGFFHCASARATRHEQRHRAFRSAPEPDCPVGRGSAPDRALVPRRAGLSTRRRQPAGDALSAGLAHPGLAQGRVDLLVAGGPQRGVPARAVPVREAAGEADARGLSSLRHRLHAHRRVGRRFRCVAAAAGGARNAAR